MSSNNPGQSSLDGFIRPATPAIVPALPRTPSLNPRTAFATSRSPSPAKRARKDSHPEPLSDEDEEDNAGEEAMDFKCDGDATTRTGQATGDKHTQHLPQMAPPLNDLHAALRDDMEVMAASITDRLYTRLAEDFSLAFTNTNSLINIVARDLSGQMATINSRVSRLQQQQQQQTPQPLPPANSPDKQQNSRKTNRRERNPRSTNDAPIPVNNNNNDPISYFDPTPPNNQAPAPPRPKLWSDVVKKSPKKKSAHTKIIPTTFPQV